MAWVREYDLDVHSVGGNQAAFGFDGYGIGIGADGGFDIARDAVYVVAAVQYPCV
jgi:hypothetical protein